MNTTYHNADDSCFIKSNILSSAHGFSTRKGGVSQGDFEGLNLGMNRGDDEETVIKNWEIFMNATGVGYKPFVCGKQVHGNKVHIAVAKDARPAYGSGELIEADGYVTKEKNLPLAIFTADCIPLLLEDKKAGVIGAIHCGWRSTVSDIAKNAITAFEQLGSRPEDICAAIGPSIMSCCFEVGEEVIAAVDEMLGGDKSSALYTRKDNGKYMLDLQLALRHRLLQLGILPEHIEMVGECTMCHPDKYYSHRYCGNIRGSLASVISQ